MFKTDSRFVRKVFNMRETLIKNKTKLAAALMVENFINSSTVDCFVPEVKVYFRNSVWHIC